MIYIYTVKKCPACIKMKKELLSNRTVYRERSAQRLKGNTGDYDEIDIEAFAKLNSQNMTLPVIVEVEERKNGMSLLPKRY